MLFLKCMVHSYNRDPVRSQRSSVEWVQAITTLAVLLLIFSMVQGSALSSNRGSEPTTVSYQKNPYWNPWLGYGFEWKKSDVFTPVVRTPDTEKLDIKAQGGTTLQNGSVQVSYYKDQTIETIEKALPSSTPRSYSRLPWGIAVIQGDLSSDRAKLVLATLHSR